MTDERKRELLRLIAHEVRVNNRNISEYRSWDDLIECSDKLTFEEWEWARDNLEVKQGVDMDPESFAMVIRTLYKWKEPNERNDERT